MNELQLIVTKNVTGVLETNIASLESFVSERLKSYSPELYNGDAVTAKKDRAELNHAKAQIAESRKALIKELMKPYEDFESRCKALEKSIDSASAKLDEIVKVKEQEEKDAKRKLIEGIWESKNFDLIPLGRVFDIKWLNKTTKLTEVEDEIDKIIAHVYDDIKALENLENATEVKLKYLETLDLSLTMKWAEQAKLNREKIQKEAEQRENREHDEKIVEQRKEVILENQEVAKENKVLGLVGDALETEVKAIKKEWVVSFTGTDLDAVALKNYLTAQGIVYSSFEEITF